VELIDDNWDSNDAGSVSAFPCKIIYVDTHVLCVSVEQRDRPELCARLSHNILMIDDPSFSGASSHFLSYFGMPTLRQRPSPLLELIMSREWCLRYAPLQIETYRMCG